MKILTFISILISNTHAEERAIDQLKSQLDLYHEEATLETTVPLEYPLATDFVLNNETLFHQSIDDLVNSKGGKIESDYFFMSEIFLSLENDLSKKLKNFIMSPSKNTFEILLKYLVITNSLESTLSVIQGKNGLFPPEQMVREGEEEKAEEDSMFNNDKLNKGLRNFLQNEPVNIEKFNTQLSEISPHLYGRLEKSIEVNLRALAKMQKEKAKDAAITFICIKRFPKNNNDPFANIDVNVIKKIAKMVNIDPSAYAANPIKSID